MHQLWPSWSLGDGKVVNQRDVMELVPRPGQSQSEKDFSSVTSWLRAERDTIRLTNLNAHPFFLCPARPERCS